MLAVLQEIPDTCCFSCPNIKQQKSEFLRCSFACPGKFKLIVRDMSQTCSFFPDRFTRRIGANFLGGLICFSNFLFDLEFFLFPVIEESSGIWIMRSCSDIPRFPQDIQQLFWFGSISPRSWFGGEMMTATWRYVFAP